MSISEKCRVAFKAADPNLSDVEVDALTRQLMTKRAERMRAEKQYAEDPASILRDVADMVEEEARTKMIEKRNRMFAVIAKKQRLAFYDQNPMNEAEALQALTIGKEGGKAGWARSTEALKFTEQDKLVGSMRLEVERTGHASAIKRGGPELDLAIAKEMARATGGAETPTGNKVAEEVGAVYAKWLEIGRNELNSNGAYIRAMPGFIVKQTHSATRIAGYGRKADFEAWRDTFLKHVDDSTFEGIENTDAAKAKFLQDTYTALSTGVHQKAGESDWLGGFTGGSANIAKRASQERTIHFKSAEDWMAYNAKYGNGDSIHGAVDSQLANAGRDIALLKVWGPNPRAAFDADLKQLMDRAIARNDREMINTLSGRNMAGKILLSSFDRIDGTANISAHAGIASIGRIARGFETMVKLTGGIASSIGDIFTRAGTLRWNGQAPLESYGKTITGLLHGRPDLEQRELLHRIGAFADGIIGDIAARSNAGDSLDGRMARWVRFSQKWNLQQWWTDVLSAQTTKDLSTTLGFYKDLGFAELPDRLKTTLTRYGITDSHWDYARANTVDVQGRAHVVSDAIKYEADDVVQKMMGKPDATPTEIARFRSDFDSAWRTYFIDQTREAITDPGAMTQIAITGGNLKPGTLMGELSRMITQFKSYPTAYIQKHINRELYRGEGADWAGITQMVIGLTVAGYIGSTIKDFARNKTIKSPEDVGDYAKILTDAFTRGGGMGIIGDVLFNDWNRNGSANAGGMMGPVIGSGAELLALAQAAVNEGVGVKDSNLTSKTIQLVSNHLPLVNVFWTKGAYEYFVLHGLMEAANPGFIGRTQRRLERENHQTYIIPPMY